MAIVHWPSSWRRQTSEAPVTACFNSAAVSSTIGSIVGL